MTVIKTKNLTKSFSNDLLKQDVLKQISIEINEGDFAGIVGPSGSGKTTLLYCLSSLEKITSGTIIFNNKDITKYTDKEIANLRKTELGFIFQFYNLIPNLTVYENVLLAKILANKQEDDIVDMLETVGMSEYKDYYPNQLSGGMQQRVAIARALINQPKIIFADEPTGNLDQKSGSEIMTLLKKLNQEKKVTIVLVTHNEEYLTYCSKVYRLLDGRVV
ncbi:MAG: ABC transporter ATP-binding protein [Tenericutes bacterium]|nr:ABC transporter ATP-binding protein [Mycoplasmatota bacterium]